ncbi:MAG: S8 family serine peptidase [Pirellulales bacterium]|nr:S8 family serine peptidase [Pirellulales bacterium]
MRRRHGGKPSKFAGRIELLEDRRVMSAAPAGGMAVDLGNRALQGEALPPAAASAPPTLPAEPDFWLDQALLASLDGGLPGVEPSLADAHRQTGWYDVLNNYGFLGRGQTVAVIDSGIAYDHFALGGGLGANYRVVGGWDFAENDADPYDDGGAGGHGTHVAGIVGAAGSPSGVAPGADLVSLRVFNDAGQGYFNWVEKALQWVLANRTAFANPITTVNLSLGVSSWNAATVPQWASLEDEFAQLESAGVFIAVSAGNRFASYKAPGLSYPAASPYVVPAMSTDDGGYLSSFSQRLDRAIAAPGRGITSTVPDYKGNNNGVADDFASMSGTSMAAPYVAAASVLIREAMQLAGMTGVTQDTIHSHMLATAEAIYDGLTKLSYKRLNLQAAIDALMPADDFGSTADAAHDLGTLAGTTTIHGAIGTLNDADFFRFTAASSGEVTFEVAETTGDMAPAWQAYDDAGRLVASGTGTLALPTVAGQTYAVRLTSTGGLGRYAFEVSAQAAFNYEDWGTVAWNQLSGVEVGGEQWYRIAAGRQGILTIQGAIQSGGGSVKLELYDSAEQLVGTSASTGGLLRVDARAAAGEQFFLKIVAAGASLDVTLANLVSQDGSTVTVAGASGDDVFQFAAGAASELTVNGLRYTFADGSAERFVVHGGAGNDSIVLRGSAGDDVASLRVGSATLVGAGYDVTADEVESIEAYGGGGSDRAELYDSPGDDEFRAWSYRAYVRGAGFAHYAYGFDEYRAVASVGYDRALLYDTAGDDQYESRPGRAMLTASTHRSIAEGFDMTWAFAADGFDRATFYDSPGNDEYHSWPERAQMIGPGYASYANGFDRYQGVASGGQDAAYLEDSAGDDLYESWVDRARMSWLGYVSEASGFDQTYGIASRGDDRAVLHDSAGHDVFRAYADRVQMKTAASTSYAMNFARTTGVASGGYDRAVLYDSAYDDVVEVRSWGAALTGPSFRNEARGFEYAAAISTAGEDSVAAEAVDYVFERVGGWQ